MTGPVGRRVLRFDGPTGPRVVVAPPQFIGGCEKMINLLSDSQTIQQQTLYL